MTFRETLDKHIRAIQVKLVRRDEIATTSTE
jgi:hypothetical protein